MTDFHALVIQAAALANTPAALAGIADELEALIFEEQFTGYQHTRLTVLLNALRMAGEVGE
jgi:hypothetical protein